MSPALFPELVTDILLRLPVRSLLRFRCLSTSLCTEIDSPYFIKNHLNRSIQMGTRQKLTVFNEDFMDTTDFYTADIDDDLKAASLLNNPLKSPHHCTLICGSCNGLILLGMILKPFLGVFLGANPTMDLAIWNPFTRRYKKLPLCPVQTLPWYKQFLSFGLGYDSALDDYKVIMISHVEESNHDSFQVWVFSLKSNSWRRSRDVLPGEENCTSDKRGEIASGSWRKEFNVEEEMMIRDDVIHPLLLAYSKERKSILLLNKENGFFWYNFENKTRQKVEIPGMPEEMLEVQTYKYHVGLESLVSLGNDSAFDGAAEEVIIDD
ncbi:hypothetical protein SLEP1_g52299 [Rubroshorea leprosula]|uniref:F-box domain-containing protein n=1 Tax=Rubroshorea leprosula TaxID=152421 RepID=A0AAV5M5S9_9ROSI|nr:hypothetical protein SLEP1_g52299 [Rubroshorea leprosula]